MRSNGWELGKIYISLEACAGNLEDQYWISQTRTEIVLFYARSIVSLGKIMDGLEGQ